MTILLPLGKIIVATHPGAQGVIDLPAGLAAETKAGRRKRK
jgi:hypothetical protein